MRHMHSTIERVIILKGADLFAAVPDALLAEVASLLVEEEHAGGATIFHKGDPGASMYLIIEGRVRIHDGPHTLNELGSRAVFGEMAVLDPAPRVASATAEGDVVLMRLESELLLDLLDRRPEIGRGLMRVLIDQLRARVQDIGAARAELDAVDAA